MFFSISNNQAAAQAALEAEVIHAIKKGQISTLQEIPPHFRNEKVIFYALQQKSASLLSSILTLRYPIPTLVYRVLQHHYGCSFKIASLPREFTQSKALMRALLEMNFNYYKDLSPQLRDDYDLVRYVAECDVSFLDNCSLEVRQHPEIQRLVKEAQELEALENADDRSTYNPFLAQQSQEYRDHEASVLSAVTKDGWSLQYASGRLRNMQSIVNAAVRQCGWALKDASPALQENKETVLAAIEQANAQGYVESPIKYASERLRSDKDFILRAIAIDPNVLQHASDALREDPDVVQVAVNKDPSALQHASLKLRSNKGFMLVQVKAQGMLLEHASADLKNNEEVAIAALENNECAIRHVSEGLKTRPNIIKAAFGKKNRSFILQWLPRECSGDRSIVLQAVESNGLELEYATQRLRQDPEVVNTAIKNNFFAEKYSLLGLSTDPLEQSLVRIWECLLENGVDGSRTRLGLTGWNNVFSREEAAIGGQRKAGPSP